MTLPTPAGFTVEVTSAPVVNFAVAPTPAPLQSVGEPNTASSSKRTIILTAAAVGLLACIALVAQARHQCKARQRKKMLRTDIGSMASMPSVPSSMTFNHPLKGSSAGSNLSGIGWEHAAVGSVDNLLPSGWAKFVDAESGNEYYANQTTGESSWTRPVGSTVQQLVAGKRVV